MSNEYQKLAQAALHYDRYPHAWPNQWFTAKRRLECLGQRLKQMTINAHALCS